MKLKKPFASMALTASIVAVSLTAGSLAHAQAAGSWVGRIGMTRLVPDVTSGNLSGFPPGVKFDVDGDTELSGGISYVMTDHWWIDVPIAAPFHHDILGTDLIQGFGKVGEFKVLPVTLALQYHFGEPGVKLRPYVGVSETYAHFYGEKQSLIPGAQLSIDSKWGVGVNMGLGISRDERWFVDLRYSKIKYSTTGHLSTGNQVDLKLDPDVYSVSLGYKF